MRFVDAIEDIRGLPFERIHVFDRDLKWLASADGNSTSCKAPMPGEVSLHNHPGVDSIECYGLSVCDVVRSFECGESASFVLAGEWVYGFFPAEWRPPTQVFLELQEGAYRDVRQGKVSSGAPLRHFDRLCRANVPVYAWYWPTPAK